MRALIIFLLLSSQAFARNCKQYEKLADYLNTKTFIKVSKEHRALKREPHVDLADINQAKVTAFRFPAFEDLGFGKPGGRGWVPYEGRMSKSGLYGKKIGWEIKNENGHARLRLDWDPEKGAHYNVEITEKKNGRSETHKLAISFNCGTQKCSEQQLLKIAERMQ